MKGIVIAGTHSGCGKTTITIGVLAALKKKGLSVQSFKAGPDFIDAGLHRLITGRPSRNLDLWMCGEDYVRDCLHRHSMDTDISIVEGVMGMYDGEFSTAALADILDLSIILVVDAYGMAESAGAVVKGFVDYTAEVQKPRSPGGKNSHNITSELIAGVIFNRVASESHYKRLKNSVRNIPVLGYLPRDLDFEIPHRHLGLMVAEENPINEERIQKLTDAVLKYIDVDMLVKLTAKTTVLSFPLVGNLSCADKEGLRTSRNDNKTKIAIAYDKAFCFYYADNLDLLRDAGAEIVPFSPLRDRSIPDGIHAIYLGGGYPELYASVLSKNKTMLESIRAWSNSGRPLYAECGGLMYLSEGIYDLNRDFSNMSGVFPFKTEMRERPTLGYRDVTLIQDCIIGRKGAKCRGHEFHYSDIVGCKNNAKQWILNNTLASYIHIHFGSNLSIANNIVRFIKEI